MKTESKFGKAKIFPIDGFLFRFNTQFRNQKPISTTDLVAGSIKNKLTYANLIPFLTRTYPPPNTVTPNNGNAITHPQTKNQAPTTTIHFQNANTKPALESGDNNGY